MFYVANFKCRMCAEFGGFQGWCLCRKSVVGDPTIKTDNFGNKYSDGEIQMWPIFQYVDDPWHYSEYYFILNPMWIVSLVKNWYNNKSKTDVESINGHDIYCDKAYNENAECDCWAEK